MGTCKAQVRNVVSKIEILCTFLTLWPPSLVIIIFVFPLESPREVKNIRHRGLHLTDIECRAESAAVGLDGHIYKNLPEIFKLHVELKTTALACALQESLNWWSLNTKYFFRYSYFFPKF